MDPLAASDLASLLPNRGMQTIYLKLRHLNAEAKLRDALLQVSSVSLRNGHSGTAPVRMTDRAIRYALGSLDALCLIERHVCRDYQVIKVPDLKPDHMYELVVALQRLQEERTGDKAYKVLRRVGPSGEHLEELGSYLKGKTWSCRLLTSAKFRIRQPLLPGMEDAFSGGTHGSGSRNHGFRQVEPVVPAAGTPRLGGIAVFPEGMDPNKSASTATDRRPAEDDSMNKSSSFRSQAEKDAERSKREKRQAALTDSLLNKEKALPVHDGDGGTETIQNGIYKTKKRKKKKSVKPFNVYDWEPWKTVHPILQEMFGEDCISVTEDQFDADGLVVEKAGMVIPAECDSVAWAAIGICFYGYKRPKSRWVKPTTAFAVSALRAWSLWIHVAGKNAAGDITLNLGTLAGRVYSGGRNSVRVDDILPILAGHCVRHVEACKQGKPEWGPNTFAWNDIFKASEADRSKLRWGKARRMGEERSTIEYLEQLPPDLPMHMFDVEAADEPTDERRARIPKIY